MSLPQSTLASPEHSDGSVIHARSDKTPPLKGSATTDTNAQMALSQGIYRLLPWTSSLGGNKVMAEMLVAPNQQAPVGATTPSLPSTLKRKRDDNDSLPALDDVHPTKRQCDTTANVHNNNNSTTGQQIDLNSTSTRQIPPIKSVQQNTQPRKMDINALRQSIDAQLSLEVLLKHDELRLIDQEIAKCQVALEQLRRCAEIPYPASTGLSQSVSSGVGHAIPYLGSGPPPTSPSPWGVADGPYSRHYSKWLLPDPRFDGGELPPAPVVSSYSTRGNAVDYSHVAGKSARAQRGSVSTRLQSLPSGYPPVKDKAGPMTIKRKSDNQLVKLVCIDCRRYDFSSTQGFINHCRIAHSRTFASHEAAAEACGEPLDVDEAGVVNNPEPAPSNASTGQSQVPGYVHPLIRTAPSIDRTSKDNKSKRLSTSNPPKQKVATITTGSKKRAVSNSFTASPAAPHLSSLMAGMGSGLNLSHIVDDAKTTVDMGETESESDDDGVTPITDRPQGARLPARTMPRPTGKGHDSTLGITTPSKSFASYPPPGHLQLEAALDPMDIGENLSPHTVESNQAPSLVSDDEDEFEAVSDSESLAGREDEEIDDIEVEDDEAATPKADVMTSLKRGHGKKGDRLLAPIVSLKPSKKKDPNSKQ